MPGKEAMINGTRIVTEILSGAETARRLELPLAQALEAEFAHLVIVGERQLKEIEATTFALMRDRCWHHYGYSLEGWACSAYMCPVRPPPQREIILRNNTNPENFSTGIIQPDDHGKVQVVFVDPHGIFCDLETVETMAMARWNSALGWGKR